jgi:hypothetical protein
MNDDDQNTANPWADFEPTGTSARFQAQPADRRVISRPTTTASQTQITPPSAAASANPFSGLDDQTQPRTINQTSSTVRGDANLADGSSGQLNLSQSAQTPMQPTQIAPEPQLPTQPVSAPQFNTSLSQPTKVSDVKPNLDPQFELEPSVAPPQQPQNFDSIAWPGETSGLDPEPAKLNVTPLVSPAPFGSEQATQAQPAPISQNPLDSNLRTAEPGVNHPQADSVIETKKPKQSKLKGLLSKIKIIKFSPKIIIIALLIIGIVGRASFAIVKFRQGKTVTQQQLSPQQQATEEIITLAQENKSQEIIDKYVRASNKEGFPTDQFKSNIQTFSEASRGSPTYGSENSGKVTVKPDTEPSDMQVYIYTSNYEGYKGKIYIRVDLFKDTKDGKWYLYAFAYNSNELKPDIVSD